jgi:hypothetical protein
MMRYSYKELYGDNDYRSCHSLALQEAFDFQISESGSDYFNPYNKGNEFKESNNENESQVIYKVPLYQLKESDFLILCYKKNEFYVFRSSYIKKQYSFDNPKEHCCIRLSKARKMNWIFECFCYEDLREFIDNLRR